MIKEPDIIRLEKIYKSFDRLSVLRGIDLTIRAGQITVILGRSGGGKSVLLKHLLGLMLPDKGRVLVDGNDVAALSEKQLFLLKTTFRLPLSEWSTV